MVTAMLLVITGASSGSSTWARHTSATGPVPSLPPTTYT